LDVTSSYINTTYLKQLQHHLFRGRFNKSPVAAAAAGVLLSAAEQ